jgi:hypothetical protein
MSQCHTEGARTRDRRYEPCTRQRGGDDLEDWPQEFGERIERDQAPGCEVSDQAFLTRLSARESFFGSAGESVSIHSAEVNMTDHGAKPDDRLEE